MSKEFRPMLASRCDDVTALKYPVLASPKLDGVRAIVMDGVVYSRSLKPIPNAHVQRVFGRAELNGLDGELIVGSPSSPTAYRDTMSGVMSEDGEPLVVLWVFDDITNPGAPYATRYSALARRLHDIRDAMARTCTQLVPHVRVTDADALTAYEADCLGRGYEGAMVRDTLAPYKFGRSTAREGWLLKIKRFHDSEAEIIACAELQHNDNAVRINALGQQERSSHKSGKRAGGTLGAVHVRDVTTGVEFDIGSGFTEEERAALWARRAELPGLLCKYRYFPMGSKERPRFPTWLGLRDHLDT